MKLLSADDIDFSEARPVVSAAQKFVIPVAAAEDAQPLLYPPGTERAGQPITDWEGKPVGERGIIFFNDVDRCYQAAAADGRSAIIINEVSSSQAIMIEAFIKRLGHSADALSITALEVLLTNIRHALGLVDLYNSTDDFIRSRMVPIGRTPRFDETRPWGWMRRDAREVCLAAFVTGPARFAGPAATPQLIPPRGAFIVREGTKQHMVDFAVMLRTYMNPDCTPLNPAIWPGLPC
jgi:hypothetical protein